MTATTTSRVIQTGPQQHTLVNTWDNSRFTLADTPAHPDGWPLDYTTDGGTTWLPSAPADLTTVNGVRARGSMTATTSGNGDALGVSNQASQWFTTNASSSFNASSSGDGWSTFFDETRVFNIHHHNGPNSIDCHESRTAACARASPSASPVRLLLQHLKPPGRLGGPHQSPPVVPDQQQNSGQVGFACLDVSSDTPVRCATPFVTLKGNGAQQDNPIDFAHVGSLLYTTDSQTGQLLCLDAAAAGGSGAACADQPYAGFAAGDNSSALISVGSNVYAYQDGEGHDHVLRQHDRSRLRWLDSADGEQPAEFGAALPCGPERQWRRRRSVPQQPGRLGLRP